jgi:DNA-binding PadR family transcriptional regulator
VKHSRKLSGQTLAVLATLAERPSDWLYGLEIAERTGLKSGSLYPILIRLSERGLLEARWLKPAAQGRPPRHAYRILPAGLRALEATHDQAPVARRGESLA